MKVGEIFESEGGYRVCGGIWMDSWIISQSPWFKTKEEAEKYSDDLKRRNGINDLPHGMYPDFNKNDNASNENN